MRKKLKAVLFDMDGVLFNSMPYHSEAWHQVMKTHGLDLSREEAYMHEGRTGASTINIVFQRELGKEATQEEIESIYHEKSILFNSYPEAERMPGAWELLQKVKSEGLTPMVVTGSGQLSLLERLLNYGLKKASAVGVSLRLEIWVDSRINFPATDLFVIIGNTLDNAIEACSRLMEEADKAISILLHQKNHMLLYEISNPYCGDPPRETGQNTWLRLEKCEGLRGAQ